MDPASQGFGYQHHFHQQQHIQPQTQQPAFLYPEQSAGFPGIQGDLLGPEELHNHVRFLMQQNYNSKHPMQITDSAGNPFVVWCTYLGDFPVISIQPASDYVANTQMNKLSMKIGHGIESVFFSGIDTGQVFVHDQYRPVVLEIFGTIHNIRMGQQQGQIQPRFYPQQQAQIQGYQQVQYPVYQQSQDPAQQSQFQAEQQAQLQAQEQMYLAQQQAQLQAQQQVQYQVQGQVYPAGQQVPLHQAQLQQTQPEAFPLEAPQASLLNPAKILDIANYLIRQNRNPHDNPLEITLASGTEFTVWFSVHDGFPIINMQETVNFRLANTLSRISIKIGPERIQSIFYSGLDLDEVEVPEGLQGIVLEVFGHIHNREAAEQQAFVAWQQELSAQQQAQHQSLLHAQQQNRAQEQYQAQQLGVAPSQQQVYLHHPQLAAASGEIPQSVLHGDKLQEIVNYLIVQNHNPNDNPLELTLASGAAFTVWFSLHEGLPIVNMQEQADFRMGSSLNKISIKIGPAGIMSIFYSGMDLKQVEVPEWLKGIVVEIFGKIQDRVVPFPAATPEASAVPAAPEAAAIIEPLPPEEPEQFSSAELVTFRAVLEKYNHTAINPLHVTLPLPFSEFSEKLGEVPTTEYRVWYNEQFKTFNLQPTYLFETGSSECKLSIRINEEGNIESVYYGNIPQSKEEGDRILAANKEKLRAVFHGTLRRSSVYNLFSNPAVVVVNRGLREIPEFHIRRYVHMVDNIFGGSQPMRQIKVAYLQDNLVQQDGVDASGLSRSYFDMIFDSLTKPEYIGRVQFCPLSEEVTNLVRPQTKIKYTVDSDAPGYNPDLIPGLLNDERIVYEDMGKMMMIAFLTPDLNTGRHFDRDLFKAILSLDPADMNIPFSQLPLNKRIAVYNALRGENLLPYVTEKMIPVMEGTDLGDAILKECKDFFQARPALPEPFMTAGEFDLAKVRDHGGGIVHAFREAILKELLAQEPSVIQSIAPIQAIARGMKSFCVQKHPDMDPAAYDAHRDTYWREHIQPLQTQVFARNIQGSLDRHTIISKIKTLINPNASAAYRQEVGKKVQWLINWIANPNTTEDELAGFLRFTTGSGSIGNTDISVIIETNKHSPIPTSHTCFHQLVLSQVPIGNAVLNDRSEAGFIKCLKYAISNSGDDFNVG